jgi:hypothetical protein
MTDAIELRDDFEYRMGKFRESWFGMYQAISKEETPEVDGTGKEIIGHRPDGYDYIEETHMRNMLDKHFPGWSWEMASPLYFLGAEWVVAQGTLSIIDPYLSKAGINPPVRKFYGVDSVRIQYRLMEVVDPNDPKRKIRVPSPHVHENIIDIGDNCKQAITAALKYAINRMTHIGDDVYNKRLEYSGAGNFETMIEMNANDATFTAWVNSHKLSWSEVMKILGIGNLREIQDYAEAVEKIRKAKGWKVA